MGPKKGKKAKKADEGAAEEDTASKPKRLPSEHDSFLMLEFKLLNWTYMNFSQKVRDSTHIFTIKKMLQQRHGRIEDLKLCLHSFTESNEVHNEMLTLRQYGCKGVIPEVIMSPEGEPIFDESRIPTVQIIYDFKPADFSDPVLLYFK